jgi:hypothetical protein
VTLARLMMLYDRRVGIIQGGSMRVRHLVSAALLGGALAGCHHRTAGVDSGGHLITASELDRVKNVTLYEAVAKLRPHFLRNRTVTAFGKAPTRQIMVYVDGEKMDGLDDLRRLWPSDVEEVRFYEPQLANTHFARYNNAGGAIAVKLRKLDPGV